MLSRPIASIRCQILTSGYDCHKTNDGTSVLDEIPLQIHDAVDTQQLVETSSKVAKPSKPAPAPAKILFLDGVRGLAAILVVSQHTREYLHDLDLGACAVDTFFVLSSFLLTMLFMKKSIRMLAQNASYRKWAFSLADYFSKRFFRVYPLFATVVFVIWLLPFEEKKQYFLVKERGHFDLLKVLTFSFPHRYFVFWTLPLEISYYFCLPVFVLGVLNLRRFWWVPFIPLYMWIVYAGWHERRSSHSPLMPHLPTFLAGSMAAALFVKTDMWMKSTGFEFSRLHKLAIRAVEYAAVTLILSVCFRRNSQPGQPAEPTMFFHWVHKREHDEGGFPFISVPVTLVIVIEMLLPSCISAMFEWSVLRDDADVELSAAECEMVLSKEEFDMLQAFHRFVPLPALTSRILRIYCEDDLQVPEAAHDDVEDSSSKPSVEGQGSLSAVSETSTTGNILRHPCRPSNLRKKPHYQINLTSQTPRIQQQQQQPSSSRAPSSSRSSADSDRSERPEEQD
ncbi:unnamed protein product [Phytophthora lilii]|uniref:Unnamed protein product n=1 Tax=Phytophthora lilii TaxID=2077276 RepID=A0A9W6X1W4_9STRA|nr:unnamed protein product [Phytophthora lilii]